MPDLCLADIIWRKQLIYSAITAFETAQSLSILYEVVNGLI